MELTQYQNLTWPPLAQQPMLAKMAEWAAWYSGEPSRIIDVYARQTPIQQLGATPWWRFWSRARSARVGDQRAMLHVPVASDLAAVSGALLFGEPPRIRIRPARTEADDPTEDMCPSCGMDQSVGKMSHPTTPHSMADVLGGMVQTGEMIKPTKAPQTPEAKAEERLLYLIEAGDFYARLVEAAEGAAAIGGVYVYPFYDPDLRDYPIMAIAQGDQAIPEFNHGLLQAVTFYRTITQSGDSNAVLRHVERHEVRDINGAKHCVVLNGLFEGTDQITGSLVGLENSSETENLEPMVIHPFPDLDVEYIPNIRPNRLWRASALGIADIQGSETLLDALDETYASWMRDVRLAKARIIVPREYLRPDPANGNQPSFDVDQEIYTGLDMDPGLSQDARAMLAHQFEIRWQAHKATGEALIERIVSNAGYEAGTLSAAPSGSGMTGAAKRVDEHKTILTLRKKSGWWRAAIANVLYHMQQIDVETFKQTYEPCRPAVLTADSIIDNPLELAQTAMALRTAQAASTETLIRLVHPDWSEDEIDAEADRIEEDTPAAPAPAVAPPGRGQFGQQGADPAATGNHPTTPPPSGPAPANAPPPQVGAPPAK